MANPSFRERVAHAAGNVMIGGRKVCRLGFGTMRLTGAGVWGPPTDRAGALRVLRTAAALGVELFDTADSYGPAVAEELLAEALAPYPDEILVTTKAGLERSGPNMWRPNGRPDYLRQCCEASLRRLKLDRIELFQLHRIDPEVPLEESLSSLVDLKSAGKIGEIGISNVSVEQLQRALRVTEIASVQNLYNLVDRTSDPVVDACEREGIVFMPWRPIQAGALDDAADAIETYPPSSNGCETTRAQKSIAWLLARSPIIVPIPGTSSIGHVHENISAAGLRVLARPVS